MTFLIKINFGLVQYFADNKIYLHYTWPEFRQLASGTDVPCEGADGCSVLPLGKVPRDGSPEAGLASRWPRMGSRQAVAREANLDKKKKSLCCSFKAKI